LKLQYREGTRGGPELNPTMQRTERIDSSGESALGRPANASLEADASTAALLCPSCVHGILPSGGSTINDVRLSAVVVFPQSNQKSL
jgi:hypothetical protein